MAHVRAPMIALNRLVRRFWSVAWTRLARQLYLLRIADEVDLEFLWSYDNESTVLVTSVRSRGCPTKEDQGMYQRHLRVETNAYDEVGSSE